MKQSSTFFCRTLVVAAVLLASIAVLGFSQNVPDAKPNNPSEPGVLVISVQAGSPAEKAGLARGDIILDINGTAVNSLSDARSVIASHKQGETISLEVRHGDVQKTLSVALGEKDGRVYMGVLLLPDQPERTGMLNPGMGDWQWALSEGAIVASVSSGGPADKAGIKKGDIILSVDGVQIDGDHSLSTLIQTKKIGDKLTLSVWSRQEPMDKAPRELKVTLGSTPDKRKPWLGVEYRMGFTTAFLGPWANFPPLADIQVPDLSKSLPYLPALPETPDVAAPVI